MSRFAQQFAAAGVPLLMEQLGSGIEDPQERVTYWPADCDGLDRLGLLRLAEMTLDELGGLPFSEGVPLVGILGALSYEEDEQTDQRKLIATRELVISTDPAGSYGGVAEPSEKATVTAEDVEYAIKDGGIGPIAAGLATLKLVRPGAAQKARPGYRRR